MKKSAYLLGIATAVSCLALVFAATGDTVNVDPPSATDSTQLNLPPSPSARYISYTNVTSIQNSKTIPGWVPSTPTYTACPTGQSQIDNYTTVYHNVAWGAEVYKNIPWYSQLTIECKQTLGTTLCGACCNNVFTWVPSYAPDIGVTEAWYGGVPGADDTSWNCPDISGTVPHKCGGTHTVSPTYPSWDYLTTTPTGDSAHQYLTSRTCATTQWIPTPDS